ncbi:Superfamily II DNA or RNA helicase [Geodermatophilus dictyosporus]|uniref:Superfamily II DNA or RNA helicase n=1 Tax=Geodermatophilus dictyosporus TaxID=1523247 RepID=A0A1I5U2J0_9ACTN|nr:DEAD/DEAH box helicase family protein [Geodermatophilus dictyosporus]SFP89518.1 Superfamily II DNA or RNA helicase [Geodermatophilus dictyosporus]
MTVIGAVAPTGLRSIALASRYRSDREDVVQSFYVPALSQAVSYSRAVGYFTSTSLALFARGIRRLADRGGKMRLIASPHLDAADIADIERGYELREVMERAIVRELAAADSERLLDGLSLVGQLIAQGVLDIKLAFVERDGRVGLYHEKLGILRDESGDLVAFTGSSNETMGGLIANFESIEVYQGWVPGDGSRALRLEADFDNLWANDTSHLQVMDFPAVARDRLIEVARDRPDRAPHESDEALTPRRAEVSHLVHLRLPAGFTPRNYQGEAVKGWLSNRGRGILKMATGTGKTKTALVAATHLSHVLQRREEPLVVVIVAPLQHLVDQWVDEVETFGVRPVAIYESSQRWLPAVEEQLTASRLGQRPVVVFVATNASFSGARFQEILARIAQPLLIIADEAHNLGSAAYRTALPTRATYRLALSATPERWLDDEGTAALTEYFGPVVYELDLGRAIELGALCRYRYIPRLVELTDAETILYTDLTAQIAQRLAAGESVTDDSDSPLGQLLRKRTGVLGHAAGKLTAVGQDVEQRTGAWFQLIYCAEGRRPGEPGDPPGPRQIEQVMDLVGNRLGLSAHTYVSDTPRRDRSGLLRRFGSGNDLRALVAMKCLDEGVDVPDARVAYLLASSSNPRQFIQRRGRILRRAPGKEQAEILDYIAVPRADAPVNFDVERKLLIRELARVNEFGRLAENYGDTLAALRPLKERYQLMHL